MKKWNKLITLIIVICAFCCIPKQIANAKESYSQISMGKVYTGTITNKNVNDRYILKVAKTGTVYFDMNVSDAVTVCIYDKNGNKLNPEFFCGYGNEPFNIQVDAGTYYIDIDQYAYGKVKYRFECSFSSAGETFGYNNNFISDLKSVSSIPYETKIKGQISMDENYDYYKVYSPKKGRLELEFSNNVGQLIVSVTNSHNNLMNIREGNDYAGWQEHYTYEGNKYYYYANVNKGIYYLRLEKCGDNCGTYSFKVTHTKDSLSAFKLTKISSKAFRISASNTGGTSGYQVKYKQDGKNWKTVTVKSSKLKKTIKKLKKKKTYRAKIRTYYTYKGKHIFSDWSRSKKISLK